MVSLNAAERWVDAGTSSLLVNTGPLIIAVLAGWLLHEGFPRALLGGCSVALAGAGVIALSVSGHGSHELLGAALSLVAAFSRTRDHRAEAGAAGRWCAAGHLVGLHRRRDRVARVRAPERSRNSVTFSATWLGVVYWSIGPTAAAFLLWAFVLAKMDAGPLSATTYVVPPLVVLISWIWLGRVRQRSRPRWPVVPGRRRDRAQAVKRAPGRTARRASGSREEVFASCPALPLPQALGRAHRRCTRARRSHASPAGDARSVRVNERSGYGRDFSSLHHRRDTFRPLVRSNV